MTYQLELNICMPLEVKIGRHWIPFEIFKDGKHKEKIDEWLELTPHNYGMDNNLDHMLILAEALGTDIRHVDHSCGIVYGVSFGKGQVTELSSFVKDTGQLIKKIHSGARISETFQSELAFVIEV